MNQQGHAAVGGFPLADISRKPTSLGHPILEGPQKPQLIHTTHQTSTTTTNSYSPPFEISVSASASPASDTNPMSTTVPSLIHREDSESRNAQAGRNGIIATGAVAPSNSDPKSPLSGEQSTCPQPPHPSSGDHDNVANDESSITSDVLNDQYESSKKSIIRKNAPAHADFETDIRPIKKQRSVSSMCSSNDSLVSTSDSVHDSIDNDQEDDDSSFDREAKIRSFPITLDDSFDDDLSSVIQYPFGELPKSLTDVAKFIKSDACQKIVILTGAGMSVVSGIPDFRSANGLYATMDADRLTATQAERDLIRVDPSIALDNHLFLQNQFPCLEVNRQFVLGTRDQLWKATLAHRFVELLHAKTGKLARLYTQNIDGLEDQCTKLPRDMVVPVHGTMDQADCGMCHNEANFERFCEDVRTKIKDITKSDPTAPQESSHIACRICGYNTVKPSIVLFRSSLPPKFFELVPKDVEDADLLIVIGTSLKVAPANSLVYRVPETCLRMLVNRDPVGFNLGMHFDSLANRDYFAEGDIDSSMLDLMEALGWVDELAPLLDCNGLPESSAQLLQSKLQEMKNRTDATATASV
ncbi:unnamed protein product [Cylindrotheca closterium]|uniref:Deacetylase sirtuin-type domain-containing protein n=1 Tax=Cylindrotheca closterium TaxID=2856 RepID=A0AAD2JJC8_9STRA|nr:unnamed protein product [Cylindrotheca closterium]